NTGPAALGERSPKCRESRAIVFGNTDANPNPDNNAPMKTPALPLASSSVTMPPNEITNPASTRPHSLTRRSIAGARALPASSAPKTYVVESDQSAGSASPPSRDEYEEIHPPIEVSEPTYKKTVAPINITTGSRHAEIFPEPPLSQPPPFKPSPRRNPVGDF